MLKNLCKFLKYLEQWERYEPSSFWLCSIGLYISFSAGFGALFSESVLFWYFITLAFPGKHCGEFREECIAKIKNIIMIVLSCWQCNYNNECSYMNIMNIIKSNILNSQSFETKLCAVAVSG